MKANGTATAVRWNAATTLVSTASQILQIVFLAHWLSPAQFGLAAVAISFSVSLQGFCDLGLTHALVQREHVPREGWAGAWWATFLAGSFLAVVLIAGALPLQAGLHLPGLAILLVAAAFTLPGFGPSAICQAHLARHLRFRRLAVADMAGAVSAMTAAVLWARFYRDAGALVAGQLASVSIRFALVWVFSRFHSFGFKWRFRWADIAPLSAFGGYQMGERAVQFAGSNMDRVLVARLLGPAATGFYTMASQVALRPAGLLGPFIARTLVPLMARLQSERVRMAAAYLRSLSMLGFLSALVYCLLFGLADPLVKLVLGTKWEGAIPTLRILCLVGYLSVLGTTLESLTLALGRVRAGFWMNLGISVTRLAGILLGAHYGLLGMALAITAMTLLWSPFDLILPRRWLNIPTREIALAGGWSLLPGLLTGSALLFAEPGVHLPLFLKVLALGLTGTVLFGALAWILHRRRLEVAIREVTAQLR